MLNDRLFNHQRLPLLDRRGGLWRGAEGDETEAGVVDFLNLIPPPRRDKFASLICLGTPPVQEGSLVLIASKAPFFSTHNNVIPFF
jgi:hypothetical protein